MSIEFDTTVLGGLPVTVEATFAGADPDVGIFSAYVDEWEIVAVNGRYCKKSPEWIYKRLTDKDEESIQEEAYDYLD